MATYHYKDGDFEMTVITHGQPDPHEAAKAILPLVTEAINRHQSETNNQAAASIAAA